MAIGFGPFVSITHVLFWLLLPYGWYVSELTLKRVGIFTALWIAARLAMPFISPFGFTAFVAALDLLLVVMIFKGDVRLY